MGFEAPSQGIGLELHHRIAQVFPVLLEHAGATREAGKAEDEKDGERFREAHGRSTVSPSSCCNPLAESAKRHSGRLPGWQAMAEQVSRSGLKEALAPLKRTVSETRGWKTTSTLPFIWARAVTYS